MYFTCVSFSYFAELYVDSTSRLLSNDFFKIMNKKVDDNNSIYKNLIEFLKDMVDMMKKYKLILFILFFEIILIMILFIYNK